MASSFTPRRLQLVGAVSNQWSNLIFLIATNLVLWIELPAWALVLCIAAGAAALCSTVYRAHLANRAIERNAVRFGYGLYFDSADPAIMGHRGMNLASGWTWLLIVTGFLPGLLASWLLNGLN
jgi:hypothetical protein